MYWTGRQCAKYVGCSPDTWMHWHRDGHAPKPIPDGGRKLGLHWRTLVWDAVEVQLWWAAVWSHDSYAITKWVPGPQRKRRTDTKVYRQPVSR